MTYGKDKYSFWKGKKLSLTHRENMRKAQLGRKLPPEVREKMRLSKLGFKNPMFGKKQSKELIKKRTEKFKGRNNWWLVGDLNQNWKGGITYQNQGLISSAS